MLEATLLACEGADLLIGSAAVADFHIAKASPSKLPSGAGLNLSLEPSPDILMEVRTAFPSLPIVGFAAEVGNGDLRAKQKIAKKGLVAAALNDVSRDDIGFESDENEVTLFFADGKSFAIPKSSKFVGALRILEEVAAVL
jgi:phosphopantothenoylcysteine decarboxylase/phosphopantothenate--cysteine ligase